MLEAATYQAICFRVTGKVQGVGFRYFTLRRAGSLGLVGSVRNLPDGSVEARAGGSPAELERFRRELGRGPASAEVTGVSEIVLDPAPKWRKFEITYF